MLVFFFFLLLVPPIWLSVRVWRGSTWPVAIKVALIVLCLLVSQMFTINSLVFGSLSGPDMPRWLLLSQAFALLCELFAFCCVAVLDLGKVLKKVLGKVLARRATHDPLRRTVLTGLCVAPLVSLSAGVGVAEGVALPTVFSRTLWHPRLPKAFNGLRCCLLTDIHIGPLTTRDWVLSTVARVQAARPDLILFAGDFADGVPSFRNADGCTRAEICAAFSGLAAPYGLWAVTGNHEYYSEYAGWMRCYARLGIRFLHNTATVLDIRGARLAILGRDDIQGDRYFGRSEIPATSCAAACANLPCFRILLDHRPTRAWENARVADLQLSGHTHGGQCRGMDALVARANAGFVRGWYQVSDMALYVSNGSGLWSGFPVRLGVPAEITQLTLYRAKDATLHFQ